jgi:hypothetical protein
MVVSFGSLTFYSWYLSPGTYVTTSLGSQTLEFWYFDPWTCIIVSSKFPNSQINTQLPHLISVTFVFFVQVREPRWHQHKFGIAHIQISKLESLGTWMTQQYKFMTLTRELVDWLIGDQTYIYVAASTCAKQGKKLAIYSSLTDFKYQKLRVRDQNMTTAYKFRDR